MMLCPKSPTGFFLFVCLFLSCFFPVADKGIQKEAGREAVAEVPERKNIEELDALESVGKANLR